MNRNFLIFSLLLIFLGFGLGLYLLSFFGILLLIPSLLSPSKPPSKPGPAPAPSRQQPRRIVPPAVQHPASTPAPQPMPETARSMAPSMPSGYAPTAFTAPLFPAPILPALSQMGTMAALPKEEAEKKPKERDELVEVGTVLALLKLVLG